MYDTPIAIIGLDARFPGDGDNAESFYEFLLAGRSARGEIPQERYNADAFWHPDANRSGATRTRAAHFLKGSISAFDAPFFSITPTEAAAMDPQQRGILESVYRALENAGVLLDKASGTQTGVFVGCMYSDYDRMTAKDLDIPTSYAALGTACSMLSNRVSWCFDFRGPSITIDTACSSSLVALHQACNSLKLRESSMAVVGGCNLILSPEFALLLDAAGVLSPDGKSHSFDHRANGYSRGEGFGVLVLKRLTDALRDGDVVRAVIRNSGSNSDGRSPGITQPTKAAQAALIKQVYANAGLDPSITRFFEAHGTGTAVGDPIEASAIAEVFAAHRSPKSPLWVGAIKSNIGHLEGAAGVAAVIKGVLSLENGVIPPNTWFERKNPKILDSWHLEFPTKPTAWPQAGLRRMSINSFGVGGSNAHVVMDDALHFLQEYHLIGNHRTVAFPKLRWNRMADRVVSQTDSGVEFTDSDSEVKTPDGTHSPGSIAENSKLTEFWSNHFSTSASQADGKGQQPVIRAAAACPEVLCSSLSNLVALDQGQQPQLFVFSSYDQDGIPRVLGQIADYVARRSKQHKRLTVDQSRFLRDLSFTLACKRTHHAWRSFGVAQTQSSLFAMLQRKPVVTRAAGEQQLAFVFTGQGSQWPTMGRSLMAYPAFRESLYEAEEYLTQTLRCPWSLTYELCKDAESSRISEAEFSQPICTALQVALVDLLQTWQVRPSAVVGHSSGEIAAAYAAGQLSRQSAWRIAYYRGKLSTKLIQCQKLDYMLQDAQEAHTGMVALGLDKDQTLATIKRVDSLVKEGGSLVISCMNSRESHTISGDVQKLDVLMRLLKEDKVFARRLNVEIGYHSEAMLPIADEYCHAIGDIASDVPASLETQDRSLPRYFSSLDGAEILPSRLQNPDYWVDNLISPVRFHEAVTLMLKADLGCNIQGKSSGHDKKTVTDLLEIGPHGALRGPIRSIIQEVHKTSEAKLGYATVLKRSESAMETALEAMGSLFCRGFDLDLAAVNQHNVTSLRKTATKGASNPVLMLTDLPPYPFNHTKEYWAESRLSRNYRLRPAPRHELLGAPVQNWAKSDAVWRNYIRLTESPWVEDHKVSGNILYPAAGMLAMTIEASRQLADKSKQISGFRFKDVSFHLALLVPRNELGVETHLRLRPACENKFKGWSEFELCTSENDDWKEHCHGFVRTEYTDHGPSDDVEASRLLRIGCQDEIEAAKKVCTFSIKTDKVYRKLASIGLDFGTTFRTLKDVRFDGDSRILAMAESRVSDIRNKMPGRYLHPHLVHPSMLDAVIHANLVSLSFASSSNDSLVPVFARDFWVSAATKKGIDLHDSAYIISSQCKHKQSTGEAEALVSSVHADTGEPMVTASGLVFKTIPNSVSCPDHRSPRHGAAAYNVEWKPNPSGLTEKEALQAFGLPAMTDSDAQMSRKIKDCEALSLLYIRRFLASLDESAMEKLGWHHVRYVAWMRHVVQRTSGKSVIEDMPAMEARVEAAATPEGKLVMAVGRNLMRMLVTRDIDALDVIFGDKVAENVYRKGLGSRRCYAQMCAYLDALAHVNPSMKILEVGAGTGAATEAIMDTLMANGARRFGHYDFTDISPSFFEHAKGAFKGMEDHMSFRVLNIEKEPKDQGIEDQSYDLILAANVLHATKSMERTLAHVRKLLKPGGKLIVFELTNPAALLGGFCFGVLPGWWLSEEADREWGPLMVVNMWRSYLERTGFSGLDAVFNDFPDAAQHTSSVLVSTALPVTKAEDEEAAVPGTRNFTRYCVLTSEQQPSDLQKYVSGALLPILAQSGSVEMKTVCGSIGCDLKGTCCIVLTELDEPALVGMSKEAFTALKAVLNNCQRVLWLTRGGSGVVAAPHCELVTGLARVVGAERGSSFDFCTISFAEAETAESIVYRAAQMLNRSQEETAGNSLRVADGIVYVPRLIEAGYLTDHVGTSTRSTCMSATTQEVALAADARHLTARLDTVRFVEGAGTVDVCFEEVEEEEDSVNEKSLADDEVEFKVMACGIGAGSLASGNNRSDKESIPGMGMEAAGIVTRLGSIAATKFLVGEKVTAICLDGAIKTHTRTHTGFVTKIGEGLTWVQAAQIPLAYLTACAIIQYMGVGDSDAVLLIHRAATSAVGLAAVQVARSNGARILVTVANAQERTILQGVGGLRAHDILQLGQFHEKLSNTVKAKTENRGVDLVIDPLPHSDLDEAASLVDCLAPLGRFVSLGEGPMPVIGGRRNIGLERFDGTELVAVDYAKAQRIFGRAAGFIVDQPLAANAKAPVYTFSHISQALARLRKGEKASVILELHEDDRVKLVASETANSTAAAAAANSSRFEPDASYAIIGGLGGLGRSISQWMASKGARNLILVSRKGAVNPEAQKLVADLEHTGVKVATPCCDVADKEALRRALDGCAIDMPPIKGVIQASMVLKDKRFVDMSLEDWNAAIRPKVVGSANIYELVGAKNLDFFIMLSSTVGLTGPVEQANYAAGGTFQDAFARSLAASQTASKAPAVVSLDLPVILDVGFVAEKPELLKQLQDAGWAYMEEDELHQVLAYHCFLKGQTEPSTSVLRAQVAPRLWLPQDTATKKCEPPAWVHNPLFNHMRPNVAAATEQSGGEAGKKEANNAVLLAAASSAGEAEKVVLDALLEKLSRVLNVELANLDPACALSRYGVDSLVAVGLRSWLSKELGAELSMFEMTDKPTIHALALAVAQKSRLVPDFSK